MSLHLRGMNDSSLKPFDIFVEQKKFQDTFFPSTCSNTLMIMGDMSLKVKRSKFGVRSWELGGLSV